MPKAARRTSAPRVEPYPAIKPGDKPTGRRRSSRTSLTTTELEPANQTTADEFPPGNFNGIWAGMEAADNRRFEHEEAKRAVKAKASKAKPVKASKKALAEKSSADVVNKSKPSDPSPTEKQKPAKASTTKSEKPSADKPSSFLEVKLDGEDTETGVPIHDTCSTIRSKINALLGKDNHKPENGIPGQFDKAGKPKPYTKAAFLRDIGGVSAGSLATFLKANKIMGGAESPVYPAAYAFFEKKRVWEGKKKTAGRLKVESE
jgi:hypothetical protein